MKKILLYTFFLLSNICLSQQKNYFYVEYASLSDVPSVTNNSNGTINLITNNAGINAIYNNYVIYNFERLSPNSQNVNLQKLFSIECNNIQLMNDLKNNYPSVHLKVEKFLAPEVLFTPNDYSIIPSNGTSNFEQRYLDEIKAKNAWDITHGSPNVIVGIVENGVYSNHEDLINKVFWAANSFAYPHGTGVSGLAAGDTNNGIGLASIGFDCRIAQGSIPQTIAHNSKVVNLSYGSPYINPRTGNSLDYPSQLEQDLFNDYGKQGIVMVAAAGNGCEGNVTSSFLTTNQLAINAENYASVRHFPASYMNVISVSTVGNWNLPNTTPIPFDNWINIHKVPTPPTMVYRGTTTLVTEPQFFHQHNDSVDIVVPAYRVQHPTATNTQTYIDTHTSSYAGWSGTSNSAPIVSGTIGLMFSANYCLKPKEVESILKLTATDIEDLTENLPYKGRLGAGSLNAFEAVKMADQMNKAFGTVEVKDRKLYRNWFYILETAPYEIKMSNNLVTEQAKVKFIARNNIEILSGDYNPKLGYIQLETNNLNYTNCIVPPIISPRFSNINNSENYSTPSKLYPNPNNGKFSIIVNNQHSKDVGVAIVDVLGKTVYITTIVDSNFEINIPNLPSGLYFAKLTSSEYIETLKFIKN